MWGVLSESQEALLTDSLKLVRQGPSRLSAPPATLGHPLDA